MKPEARIRLARAHAILAVLLVALAAASQLLPSGTSRLPKPHLVAAATVVRLTAMAYLLLSGLAEWQRAAALRSLDQIVPRRSLLALLGHVWVLWVAGAAAWRGAQSRTLLAGGDPVLAALITASGLALALLVAEWWQQWSARRDNHGDVQAPADSRFAPWLSGIAGWLVVLALWYIETIPLGSR